MERLSSPLLTPYLFIFSRSVMGMDLDGRCFDGRVWFVIALIANVDQVPADDTPK